jgi:hypothetical protein
MAHAVQNSSGPISPRSERRGKDAIRAPRQQAGEVGLAHGQRQAAQVFAIEGQEVERVELRLGVLAQMQRVEVGDTINAEHDGLAVDDEAGLTYLARRLDDPRISVGKVVTLGDQADPVAVALKPEPEAVVT